MRQIQARQGPWYIVIDANSFFVSCERLFRPDLAEKPVVVLSSNDGCVIARSTEAKQLDIPMGAPYFKVKDVFNRHGVVWFSSNFSLYVNISGRLSRVINRLAGVNQVWQYSVDEWFIKTDELETAKDISNQIIKSLNQELGVPVAIGIANNKTLAKAAVWQAKKSGQSVYWLDSAAKITSLLARLPVEDVWGVGFRTQEKLKNTAIKTALDLVNQTSQALAGLNRRDIVFYKTIAELSGELSFEDSNSEADQKSMAMTRTFGQKTSSFEELEGIIAGFTTSLCSRLRTKKLLSGDAYLFIRAVDNRSQIDHMAYTVMHRLNRRYISRRVIFEQPSSETFSILADLLQALKDAYEPGYSYDRAGISLFNIIPESFAPRPLDNRLFSSARYLGHDKRSAIWQKADKAGVERLIKPGSELLKTKNWQPKKEWSSRINPAKLGSLPVVN